LHHAIVFEGASREARQDEGLLGSGIIEHAQHLDLELLDAVPGKDRTSDASHSGPHIFQREERRLGVKQSGQRQERRSRKSGHTTIVPGWSGRNVVRSNVMLERC
jgi:hypothetical protein